MIQNGTATQRITETFRPGGTVQTFGDGAGNIFNVSEGTVTNVENARLENESIFIRAVGRASVSERVDILGIIGIHDSNFKGQGGPDFTEQNGVVTPTESFSRTLDTSTELLYGLGVEADINERFSARAHMDKI